MLNGLKGNNHIVGLTPVGRHLLRRSLCISRKGILVPGILNGLFVNFQANSSCTLLPQVICAVAKSGGNIEDIFAFTVARSKHVPSSMFLQDFSRRSFRINA